MLKFIKVIFIGAIIVFAANCTKTTEDQKENLKKSEVLTEKVTDEHAHVCTIDHGEGNSCIDPVASKFTTLVLDGKDQEAINVMLEAKDVPGYQWDKEKIYESIVYLQDKTKQYKKNLDIWRDGHSKGIVFKMDKTKKHFEPYLMLEGFDEIYEKDLELQKTAEIKK